MQIKAFGSPRFTAVPRCTTARADFFLSQERTSLVMPAEIAEAISILMTTLTLSFSLSRSRLHLSPCSKLPSWARAVVPKIFYVTEKAWNYYPYTITGNCTQFICFRFKCLKASTGLSFVNQNPPSSFNLILWESGSTQILDAGRNNLALNFTRRLLIWF